MNPAATVATATANYPVYVEPGCLRQLGPLLSGQGKEGKAFIISDANVADHWAPSVSQSLEGSGIAAQVLLVEPGEGGKTLQQAASLVDQLVAAGAERHDTIVALGGGVVGDLAGFVAAIYLRGIALVQAPTSLLAMADAAIGGKTGVNHRAGKNLVGAFHQPLFVLEDPRVLSTMPKREFNEGWAEIVKHGLILDPALLDDLLDNREDLMARDETALARVLAASARVKAGVVSVDERESERRAWLNYGHTVGHALEAAAGYGRYLHGEAVAIGMVAAARLGLELGLLSRAEVDLHLRAISAYGLPLKATEVSRSAVVQAMTHDKKRRQGKQQWVLLDGLGRPTVRDDVAMDAVEAALREAGIE